MGSFEVTNKICCHAWPTGCFELERQVQRNIPKKLLFLLNSKCLQ